MIEKVEIFYMQQDIQSHNEKISFLSLCQIKGIGFYTLQKIASSGISYYDLFSSESLELFANLLKKHGSRNIDLDYKIPWKKYRELLWNNGENLHKELQQKQVTLIFPSDPEYPKKFHNIDDPPNWLFVQGNIDCLNFPDKSIAIVGTRNPTNDGLFLAKYIGALLDQFCAVTISGLAPGIDQIIHKYSINQDIPTIAFLGTGIFSDYPADTKHLKNKIIEKNGAIVTEYLPNQSYSSENFVKRNRLQAALSDILIPVEWKHKSGTAHTVKYALKYNKRIICLKMRTWKEQREELEYANKIGADIITIPGQESKLLELLSIKITNYNIPRQGSLF